VCERCCRSWLPCSATLSGGRRGSVTTIFSIERWRGGCCSGATLPLLRKRFPASRVIGFDLAHGALRQARSKRWFRRQPVCQGDFHHLPFAAESIDLVVANLALHWAVDLRQVLLELRRVVRPGGMVLFSTFGPDTLVELRQAWYQADPDSPHVLAFADMHDLGDALMGAGFDSPVLDREAFCLTYSTTSELFAELRRWGLSNACVGRRRGLTGTKKWQEMAAGYQAQRSAGRLPATFEVVYGHAWVGDGKRPGTAVAGSVAVPFITNPGA